MTKIKSIFIVINLLLLIGYFNWSIYAKERILSEGKLVLIELAPVDPRSLMQGDYMHLNYKENTFLEKVKIPKRGFCLLKIDSNGIGHRIALIKDMRPLGNDEVVVKYFFDGNEYWPSIHIGAESYFFQEGKGKKYEAAKYGGLKIDRNGNSILVGLYNKDLKLIL
ncbi:hypothetical protein DBR40_13345 [Pedobacter sp. KBW01]|uniref:GDYXXLXY domain-containing protein n=1 Tax=Pedobacter sp. KBW01 TaxID=2153364 RepID=UPI000F58F61E|nr:GDYXXLXY domain-containing protein [Pedobacter sp. KBW01]RQO73787.1 hypothetical protein DBR40_13345 [Pedobacter sp. KBW01]